MKRSTKAALFLIIFSPSIAELLSSSAPPLEFFNPIGFLFLTTFYGFGALLIREFRIRRGLGYSSVLFLGMAYGIVEEGISVKSFFSTDWPDLGALAWYGRALGVNWVWSFALTIYHGVVSIFIPIVITEILFRDIDDEPWIKSRRNIAIIASVFIFDVLFFNLVFVGHFQPSPLHYLLSLLSIASLYWLSTWYSIKPFYLSWGPFRVWISGVIWMLLFYIIFFGSSNIGIPYPITLLIGFIHVYLGIKLFMLVDVPGVPLNVKTAVALGPPSLFIFLAPFIESDPSRTDNPVGMTLVAIAFAFIFLYLYLRSRRAEPALENESL